MRAIFFLLSSSSSSSIWNRMQTIVLCYMITAVRMIMASARARRSGSMDGCRGTGGGCIGVRAPVNAASQRGGGGGYTSSANAFFSPVRISRALSAALPRIVCRFSTKRAYTGTTYLHLVDAHSARKRIVFRFLCLKKLGLEKRVRTWHMVKNTYTLIPRTVVTIKDVFFLLTFSWNPT